MVYKFRTEPLASTAADSPYIGGLTEVKWGDCAVSSEPMGSFGYSGCRALVFQNGKHMGLSHIWKTDTPPMIRHYVKGMLGHADPADVMAFISAGLRPECAVESCREFEIPVVGTNNDEENPYWYRDVIVVPSTREVFIYSEKGKETFVFPEK